MDALSNYGQKGREEKKFMAKKLFLNEENDDENELMLKSGKKGLKYVTNEFFFFFSFSPVCKSEPIIGR